MKVYKQVSEAEEALPFSGARCPEAVWNHHCFGCAFRLRVTIQRGQNGHFEGRKWPRGKRKHCEAGAKLRLSLRRQAS